MIWQVASATGRLRPTSLYVLVSQEAIVGWSSVPCACWEGRFPAWPWPPSPWALFAEFLVLWPLGLRLAGATFNAWVRETLIPGLTPGCRRFGRVWGHWRSSSGRTVGRARPVRRRPASVLLGRTAGSVSGAARSGGPDESGRTTQELSAAAVRRAPADSERFRHEPRIRLPPGRAARLPGLTPKAQERNRPCHKWPLRQ